MEYEKPLFRVDEHDKDGDVVEHGIYLCFGPITVRVAKSLEGFAAFIAHLQNIEKEISQNYCNLTVSQPVSNLNSEYGDCMNCERCDTNSNCPDISESRFIDLLADKPAYPWPDPKPEDLEAEDFNLIWDCIKTWDINVPEAYAGYCGATGNHVMSILFAADKRNIMDYC